MTRLGSSAKISRKLERSERRIARAWIQSILEAKAGLSLGSAERAVSSQDIDNLASQVLSSGGLTPVVEEVRSAYRSGGSTIEESVPSYVRSPSGGRLMFRLDIMDPAAQEWLSSHSSSLVTRILADQREAVRLVLARGMEVGRNPRSTALDIIGRINPATRRREGGVVGLTRNQAAFVHGGRLPSGRWVAGARGQLESGDPSMMRAYLTRKRRDRRFDRTVLNAINSGKALEPSIVDRIIGRYEDRMLQLRGETIARTESIQAFAKGRHEAFEQLRQKLDIRDDDFERSWDATMDKVTREDHQAMDGQRRTGDDPFEAPDGSLMMHPGDLSLNASASQIINCRCIEQLEVDFVKVEARRNRG